MRRWRPLLVLLAFVVAALVVAEATGLRRRAWRSLYPNLPPIVQVLPYRAAAELRRLGGGGSAESPALPTARAAARATPASSVIAGSPTAADVGDPSTAAGAIGTGSALPQNPPEPTALQPTALHPTLQPTAPPPPEAWNDAMRHEYQTWNNCGPATIGMAMSAWDWQGDQRDAAARLKPDPDDKNVGPEELARFARESGMRAIVRHGGTIERMRALIASGLPVIIETWFIPEPGDEMGHYVVLDGFDAEARTFRAMDSYHGRGITLPWDEFDALWRVFGRVYVVVYTDDQAETVERIIGTDMNDEAMWIAAAATAQQETLDIDDGFAHFNLGSALLALGDANAAAAAFDTARSRGLPWRMLWYQFTPYEAYAAVGRWDDVFALADATLARVGNLEESLYWRGRVLEARGDVEAARRDWRKALEINPLYEAPANALQD